ncbi:TMEM175 family protein [Pleionea sediminis]|uniref:TMEM175 family protein n=1 Tax=Pleionea sediminis TaxID=2569479 RepID=UPI001186FDF5|nr:TMEM175 family protein [Pleionea sediminis]
MINLTQEFVDGCREEHGYKLRGEGMTRIEVFVDAAFAFAVTMLVISIDQIPRSMDELMQASKLIPAFIASVIQLMWIWHGHSLWSKRFGLEDGRTVLMSAALLIIVLVYIYPLKMMFAGMFSFLSDGFFPTEFVLKTYQELRYLFTFFAIGFIAIGTVFLLMYHYALRLKDGLKLTKHEVYLTETNCLLALGMLGVGVIALVLPYLVLDKWVSITGFVYALLGVVDPLISWKRRKNWEKLSKK